MALRSSGGRARNPVGVGGVVGESVVEDALSLNLCDLDFSFFLLVRARWRLDFLVAMLEIVLYCLAFLLLCGSVLCCVLSRCVVLSCAEGSG